MWDHNPRLFTKHFGALLSPSLGKDLPRPHPTAAATHSFLCPFPTSLPFKRAPSPHPALAALISFSISSKQQTDTGNNLLVPQLPRVRPRITSSSHFYCHFISRDAEGQGLHLLLKMPSLLQALPRSQRPQVGWKTPGPAAGTKPRCAAAAGVHRDAQEERARGFRLGCPAQVLAK